MEQTLESKTVYRAELHVHTPSSNCYKGPKTDEEYLRIIETAFNKKIDILAITDHNSIKGYLKIRAIKQRISNEYSALVNISDSKEAKARTKQLRRSLDALDSVFLIPGVEFEVNNGIHLLVLFNPNTPENIIERFLLEGGYDEGAFGKENDVFSNWSIYDLYKESKKYDCIVIDAHSDSNKGILNTLGGQPRVHAFNDPSLMGICYKSEKQKNNIENLLSQYSRTTPISFLKASDAHQTEEIGKDVTFFRLKEKNWDCFKEAFNNPTECISTTYPQTNSILKRVANSGSCLFVKQIDDDSMVLLCRYICGLANANGGFIIIGAESINSIGGLVVGNLDHFMAIITQKIQKSILGLSRIQFNVYPIKDGSYVIVAKVHQSEDLLGVEQDKNIYQYQGKGIEILTASKIQSLITHRLMSLFSERINTELDSIRMRTTAIDTLIKSLPILNSFYNRSVFLTSVVTDVSLIEPVHLTAQQFAGLSNSFHKHENGVSRGNVFYFEMAQKPRLSDAFLRNTLPCFTVKGLKTVNEGPVLYVVPGGAVFYSEKTINCYYKGREPVIKVKINKEYPIKFLCAYLKTSFFIWYVLNKYNTLDIVPPSIFNSIKIPQLNLKNPKEVSIVNEVEQLFDQIVSAEKAFLVRQNTIKDSDALTKLTMEHNDSMKALFKRIDNLFFSIINLSESEQQIVMDNLRVNGVFVPE